MCSKLIAACLALAAIVALSGPAVAAPGLRIDKGPVSPLVSWTGPFGDPHATLGQWFLPTTIGPREEYRQYEFYDNTGGNGGSPGWGSNCIKGIAQNVQIVGGNITAFEVLASITNDTPGSQGTWLNGADRHGESLRTTSKISGDMYGVKLTASFAVDPNLIPGEWGGPRIKREPFIFALGHTHRAWYCWTPTNDQGLAPVGGYFVPTWDFGTITTGTTVTKTLKFGVDGAGIPPTDSRYAVIMQSWQQGTDMFANRTTSLKVSDWIDDCYTDTGAPYLELGNGSDVSVFYRYPDAQESRDWADAPDPPYNTLPMNAGPNHIIVANFCLGNQIDAEGAGLPDPNALGDDNNNLDDEDGVLWIGPLIPGQPAQVEVFLTNGAGVANPLLQAWIDFNADGSWATAGDQIITNQPLVAGVNLINFNVPATATGGITTFARFRLSTVPSLPYFFVAKDGEVEDHTCFIEQEPQRERDWGDAPEAMGVLNYPTTSANGGASHIVVAGNPALTIGALIDTEADGQPDPNALGDDNNNLDDEEGVSFSYPYVPGLNGTVGVICTVPVGTTAYLNGWIDFGFDGGWGEAGDQIITDAIVSNGNNVFTFPVPASAGTGQTFARFRLSTQAGLGPGGAAQDGEVEDHRLVIEAAKDWGDAPEGASAPTYPTRAINNGPYHEIVTGFCLGTNIDAEADGQPDPNALGDDNNGVPDDEDGVTFTSPLIPGANAVITVVATLPSGTNAYLDGWIDFNGDGNWTTAGDRIFTAQPVSSGANVFSVPVPATASVGVTTFARFRLSSDATGLPFTGGANDGEVEDYEVRVGYKWIQRPDLTPTGIDVRATLPNILADDFKCTVTGPITDIHIWGSWKYDEVQDPGRVKFILSFHRDIPAGTGGIEYSRPGEVLWHREFQPGDFDCSVYKRQIYEGWWDPATAGSYIFPGDFTCYQYDFYIQEEPFTQRGSEENPVVYWLDVQAIPEGTPLAEFGWKTCVREDRWNDDAVWGQGAEPFTGTWTDMHYPPGHELYPQTLDMAFALTGHAEPRDWGDAPDPTYPTLSGSNGANHAIVQGFCLGNLIDAEGDGQPNAGATGDDIAGLFDEDGVVWLTPVTPGQPAQIQVTLTDAVGYPAFLDAWIDFDGDGNWTGSADQIANAFPLAAGPNVITFNVPRTWNPHRIGTFSRFRLTSYGGVPFTGPASDGEVEDHALWVEADRGTLTFSKFNDLPDHFWWRTDPDPYNEMLSLKVGADSVEAVSWDSVTLQLAGGAPGDVTQIAVWLDNNSNGVVDVPGDTQIGTVANPPSPVTINLAPAPVIPANGDVKALISYRLSPLAPVGTTYSFQVMGAAGTGQTSGFAAYITGLPIASCRKIVALPPITIGEAKLLPVGSTVLLQGKEVTAVFGTPPSGGAAWNLFYIEEKDRSAGIGVQWPLMMPAPVAKGDKVSLLGTTMLLNGTELVIQYTDLVVGPIMLPLITPVGMNNKWTGGGTFGGQPAVYDQATPLPGTQAAGLSNVGSLIRTWGLVTYHDSAFATPTVSGPIFWIDDGSDLHDGFMRPLGGWTEGVACFYGFCGHPGSLPDIGEYWGVTGIMRAIPNANLIPQAVRLLVPRAFPDDLNEYPIAP